MTGATPPQIPAYAAGSFAHFTVQRRLPKILADAKAEVGREDSRWSALESAIRGGGAIDLRLFAPDTPFWQRKLAGLAGATWSELPFFDLEFLFYLAIDSIARELRPGFDVFASIRRAALAEALPRVARLLESTPDIPVDAALLLATSGNEADLSQLANDRAAAASLLVDERPGIVDRLAGDGPVAILADNAGSELCFDLVLVDRLLGARSGSIEMHLKPRPMFVSDAMILDVEQTIEGFRADSRIAGLGARLERAVDDGRLRLRAPPDWAEPRPMNALEPELAASLGEATVVLAKGDLNYRRFFEDRAWPADCPVRVASVGAGMCAFALRVLKSDSIVGLAPEVVSRLFAADPDWRSDGSCAIVQRVDRGSS